ncbi:hypothetical protein KM043_011602 [Ampulex compressa]|nr:hypothetical protein KM043_011602 [Ampulex compressa]
MVLRMSSFARVGPGFLCLLWCILVQRHTARGEVDDENRPYEFSFNIVDFQHRFEKKDADGIITGEYGFITADGVYHETGYATDKNGDFIITKMRNRKITSLKDARDIFKDRPEAAKKLAQAVAMACSSCKIKLEEEEKGVLVKSTPTTTDSTIQKKVAPVLREMMKTLAEKAKIDTSTSDKLKKNGEKIGGQDRVKEILKSMVDSAKKVLPKSNLDDSRLKLNALNDNGLEKMANDLYYRFNYTITSHGHHEDGYRSGRKDGGYRAQSENGVDTQGYSFIWYWL